MAAGGRDSAAAAGSRDAAGKPATVGRASPDVGEETPGKRADPGVGSFQLNTGGGQGGNCRDGNRMLIFTDIISIY